MGALAGASLAGAIGSGKDDPKKTGGSVRDDSGGDGGGGGGGGGPRPASGPAPQVPYGGNQK
jgi:hypothetical protein